MPGLFPCGWGDPTPIFNRSENKKEVPLFNRLCKESGEKVKDTNDKKTISPFVCSGKSVRARSTSGGEGTKSNIIGNSNSEGRHSFIPDEEMCDRQYELPEFLKDPKYRISQDDEVRKVVPCGYVSERSGEFLKLLAGVNANLNEKIKLLQDSGVGQGTIGSPKETLINFLETFTNVNLIVKDEFNNMFPNGGGEMVDQLREVIHELETLNNGRLYQYKGMDCADNEIVGDGEEMMSIFMSLSGSYSLIHALFKRLIENRCPDDIIDIVKGNSGVTDYKFIDTSSTKLLLIKIPEKLFLKNGYKSVERLMVELEKKGVVVAAVPESINLYEISEDDLKNLDLSKVNKCSRKNT